MASKSLKKKTSKPLIPDVEIDLSLDPAEHILPCEEAAQGRHLKWRVQDVRSVNRSLRLYDKLPMICQAEDCYWASQCPTRPDFVFEGLKCPYEVMVIYRSFVGYIRELDVQSEDYVDLQMIEDLVRIDLQLSQCDQRLQLMGMWVDQTAGIAQKTGTPIRDKAVNPLLTLQSKLRDDRNKLYKQLLASRDAKQKVESVRNREQQGVLNALDRLTKRIGRRSFEDVVEGEIVMKELSPGEVEDNLPDDEDPI